MSTENHIALIRAGIVENVIVADLEFAQTLGYDHAVDVTGLEVGIGWLYAAGEFTAPALPTETPAPTPELRLELTASTHDAPINQPVTITARLLLGDATAPVSQLFRVPILNAAGQPVLVKGVEFVEGSAEVVLTFAASGYYRITEEAIKSRLEGLRIAMPAPFELTIYE